MYLDPDTLPRLWVESLPGYIVLSRESGCICILGLWGGKGKKSVGRGGGVEGVEEAGREGWERELREMREVGGGVGRGS